MKAKTEETGREQALGGESSWMAVAAALSLLGAWFVAVVMGHGFEWHRLSLAMPLAALAALFACLVLARGQGALSFPILGIAVLGVSYFAWRTTASPVWDLARLDLWLVIFFWISLVVGSVASTCNKARAVILGGSVLVVLGHFGVGIVQGFSDPAFAVLRPDRTDQAGVSGLYWHRNYLAGFLECLLPLFLGVLLVSKNRVAKLLFVILLAGGLVLVFLTKSRTGILATGVGLTVALATYGLFCSRGWSAGKRILIGLSGITLAVAGSLALMFLISKVSEDRGRGNDLEAAFGDDSRVKLVGLAYDQWIESPVVGTGGRTFSYLALHHWDRKRMSNWLGDPVMVHNDYMQTLAEYGLVGLIFPIAFAGAAILVLVSGNQYGERAPNPWRVGAAGALGAVMVHGVFDFSLHVLPNLMALGLVCGAALGRLDTGKSVRVASRLQGAVTLFVGAAMIFVGWGSVMAAPGWLRWEAQLPGSDKTTLIERVEALRTVLERVQDFDASRAYGTLHLDAAQQNPEDRVELLSKAVWALEIAAERHPHDPVTLGNLALALHQTGRLEEATRYHILAAEKSWKRENKYGSLAALSYNLSGLGELWWLDRKPEEALGYFELALEYLEESWALNYRPGQGAEYRPRKQWLEERIELLSTAGIIPEAPTGVPTVEELTD